MSDHIVPTYTIAVPREITESQREHLFDAIHGKFDAVANYQFTSHAIRLNWYGDSFPCSMISFTCVKDHDAMDRFEFSLKLKHGEVAVHRATPEDYARGEPLTHEKQIEEIQDAADMLRGSRVPADSFIDMIWARLKR